MLNPRKSQQEFSDFSQELKMTPLKSEYFRSGLLKLWAAKCNFGVAKQIGLTNQI